MSVTGYAAEVDGNLVIETVGPHERAAKANGLLVLFGVMPLKDWTNSKIDTVWFEAMTELARRQPGKRVEIVAVTVIKGDRAYTQAEVNSILKAAFPQA